MGRAILAFVIGAVCGIAATLYFRPHPNHSTEIVFPDTNSVDGARMGSDDFLFATGTLTGEGVEHKNNLVQVDCYKSEGRCLVFEVDQIAENQLGDVYWPLDFPISRWDPLLVTATTSENSLSGYPGGCIRSTVNLERESRHGEVSVEFVEEPINQADKICQNSPTSFASGPSKSLLSGSANRQGQ
jgi:hypothetical protein